MENENIELNRVIIKVIIKVIVKVRIKVKNCSTKVIFYIAILSNLFSAQYKCVGM